jgi:hypothetical protein
VTPTVPTINWSSDYTNGISSATGRLVDNGVRAAQVRPDSTSKHQIAALLDLLDLHLGGADAGTAVDADRVRLRVPSLMPEARGALGTLVNALKESIAVEVVELQGDDWAHATIGWDINDTSQYPTLDTLLARPRPVPKLVTDIVEGAGLDSLRAYPMLSTVGGWSLRLEGLEVGRVSGSTAVLGVGKDGKGGRSAQREAWLEATGHEDRFRTDDADAVVAVIKAFSAKWQDANRQSPRQDEHALESRILRDAASVTVNNTRLALIATEPMTVNWGSQFPCKWGPSGKWRYLDALLRDGRTPWAVEMKVQGGAGVGQYYRHAVAQAVLYREFLRRAEIVRPWFLGRGLDAAICSAAVVVPEMTSPSQAKWRTNVQRLCTAFGVAFVEVDPQHALRHPA